MANPQDIVRNPATNSSAHDFQKAKELQDANRRRAQLDQQRALEARSKSGDAATGHARVMTKNLGGVHSHAAIVLRLTHKDGTTISFETCELSADDNGLTLVIVCPACIFRHRRRQSDSQITLRSWHRRFSLTDKLRGRLWVNPENRSETVQLAGGIVTHEKQTCPTCSFRFEIDEDRASEDHLRVSGVIREA